MKNGPWFQVSVAALAVSITSTGWMPQEAQAHHNPIHSTAQTATTVAVNPPPVFPLTLGGAALLSLLGVGVSLRKQQSV
jgi:hypothetical protein